MLDEKTMYKYRTQKAKGLGELCLFPDGINMWPCSHISAIYGANVWPHEFHTRLPAFARPCPTTPRHGFVESRPVRYLDDALRVISDTLAADPNGEVIFMDIIPATVSGIMTNGGMVIGPGNDGATSGHGSYTVPAPIGAARWKDLWRPQIGDMPWSIKNTPYIEWVSGERDRVEIVQSRDGPESPASDNYIPEDFTVRNVLNAGGDLLEWEETVKILTGEEGTVVYHPGGSLASHYAVHCILHRIPVFVTKFPEEGRRYVAECEIPMWTERDYKHLAHAISLGTGLRCANSRSQANMAVAAMHAGVLWTPKDHLIDLLGIGVVYAARYIAAACAGEGRHFWDSGPGRFDPTVDKSKSTYNRYDKPYNHHGDCHYKAWVDKNTPWRSHLGALLATPDRDTVYEQAFDWPWDKLRGMLDALTRDFEADWRRGYGGQPWVNVATAGSKLVEAVDDFIATPSNDHRKAMISAWNYAINVAHNGGKVMTKWVSTAGMKSMAHVPAFGFSSEAAYKVCRSTVWADLKDELRTARKPG